MFLDVKDILKKRDDFLQTKKFPPGKVSREEISFGGIRKD